VLQILHTDHGEFQTFASRFDKVKIVCLTVVDRDGNRLLARVAAHLTDTAVHLREGHVLRLRMFNDLLMSPHKHSPPTAVIVIVQMDVMGSGPFITAEENMRTPTLDSMPTESKGIAGGATNIADIGEEFEPPPVLEHPCTYSNRRCSVYGLNFRLCVCDKIPVADQDLTSIKSSCPFASGGPADCLSANEKRNMVYWWYATNLFLICGKGRHGPLPDCLVYAIRCCYPNPKGIKYVRFLEKDEQVQKRKRSQLLL